VTHLSDDDLVLHYYRDPGGRAAIAAHLNACAPCAGRYAELASTLALLPEDEVPSRNDLYGLEVWQRLRPSLPAENVMGSRVGYRLALAVAASLALAAGAAFIVSAPPLRFTDVPAAPLVTTPEPADANRRALLLSIADHLERSDRVLTEVMNVDSPDISVQQGWAEDLLWAGRLYRQSALDSDEQSVAAVLDDVERTLLDIVHSPPQPAEEELEGIRRRVESAAILFKVRVLREDLHEQQIGTAGEPATMLSETS
jgi:hypothetical protein